MASNISREIWSNTDNVFLIFMGSTVDAALDPAVMDWIYFSGGIIQSPFERLFSTISYSRKYLEMGEEEAMMNANRLREMHTKIEEKRSNNTGHEQHIPNESFLRVLSGIIDYGIKGYEYLNRKPMSDNDKESFYQSNAQMGRWMHIKGVPETYQEWEKYREKSFKSEFQKNEYTDRFYRMLRNVFGPVGFWMICNFQALFVDPTLSRKFGFKKPGWFFKVLYKIYPYVRNNFMLKMAIRVFVPKSGQKVLLNLVDTKPQTYPHKV